MGRAARQLDSSKLGLWAVRARHLTGQARVRAEGGLNPTWAHYPRAKVLVGSSKNV